MVSRELLLKLFFKYFAKPITVGRNFRAKRLLQRDDLLLFIPLSCGLERVPGHMWRRVHVRAVVGFLLSVQAAFPYIEDDIPALL